MTSYGGGGGPVGVVPAGQLFAGRSLGGATRSQIFGTRTYGSGYPGISSRGVTGRGFPFYFWPVVWGGAAASTLAVASHSDSYLYTDEYGFPSNTSRPGGALYTASFQSNSTGSAQTILRIFADNATIADLVTDISRNCSTYLTPQSGNAAPFNTSAPAPGPKPEQVIQYYRASSVALTLDGYNNTAVFGSEGSKDVDLPSTVDSGMIYCVNQTIGVSVPLIDGSVGRFGTIPGFQVVGIVSLVWVLIGLF
ncbi:hypothetical protein L218DRAFT_874410 [Marasmius fiardii PR-910]|nr:hypothetical protein L218DRAFT_874410 [Marasmius fiardii PR-910]